MQRPELAAQLGGFVAEWGAIESVMAVLFAALLKTNGELSTGILDRVLSTRQKLSILKFTAEQAVVPGGTRDGPLDAICSVQDLLEKRNDLIHGRWGVSESAGLIRYAQGEIQILNRMGLERASCECYEVARAQFGPLLSAQIA